MKILFHPLLVLFSLLSPILLKAQSTAFSFTNNLSGYSIEAVPGTADFVAAGTLYDPSGNNNIHVFATATSTSYTIGTPGYDDRCVKIIATNTLSPATYAVVSYIQNLTGPVQGQVHVMLITAAGALINQNIYSVPAPRFNSLYPLDAMYDPINDRIVICGAAVTGSANSVGTAKQAFLLSVDATSLTPLVYSTYANPGIYSIATRVKMTSSGAYYMTGSETFNKGAGTVMVIRNMLISPLTLGILFTRPLILATGTSVSENGVDMYESPGAYCILANTQLNTWGIIRVNKSSLAPLTGSFESDPIPGVAYGFQPGNNAAKTDAVVYGMLNPGATNAVPFTSFIDLNLMPGNVYLENEYLTTVGNAGFWTTGNFYAENNGYPLPSFLHAFTKRVNNLIATPFQMVAPIKGTTGSLNFKLISMNLNGNTSCPASSNLGGLNIAVNVAVGPIFTSSVSSVSTTVTAIANNPYPITSTLTCSGGYYKLADIAGTDASAALFYPNPSTGSLHLNLSGYGDSPIAVRLLDLTGKCLALVYEGNARDKIDYQLPAGIARGLYLLSFEAGGGDRRIEKLSIE